MLKAETLKLYSFYTQWYLVLCYLDISFSNLTNLTVTQRVDVDVTQSLAIKVHLPKYPMKLILAR